MAEVSTAPLSEEQIAARIERLPLSGWYMRLMSITGTAHFFDAFDSLTIASVLPILIGLWQINPADIGLLISAGFVGQAIGSFLFGWLAEKHGRLKVLQWSLVIIAIFAIASAFAWSYWSLLALRLLQGVGLGAEVPVAATYLNEYSRAQYRGRLIMFLQICFSIGVAVTSLVALAIIPAFGWQSMYILGALPIILALPLRRLAPESARWLARNDRLPEADAVVKGFEARAENLPPLPATVPAIGREQSKVGDLFSGMYARRTLVAWGLCFCTACVGYGLLTWLPSIFRIVFKASPQEALQYNSILTGIGLLGAILCLLMIDSVGRRISFTLAFIGAAIGMFALWRIGAARTASEVLWYGSFAIFFMSFMLPGIYIYIPETYPTRMRALGIGVAAGWYRIAIVLAPTVIGWLLTVASLDAVFVLMGCIALAGAAIVGIFAVETKGRTLEEISP
jgi:putative MFS transporter